MASENKAVSLENGIKLYLDIIRIVAATLVLLGHSFYAYNIGFLKDDTLFPPIQSIAVVIFFWLSGFLIARQFSSADESFSLKSFAIHKAQRIIPEYWLCLFGVLGIDALHIIFSPEKYVFYEAFNAKTFIGNMFFLQGVPIDGVNGVIDMFGSARPLWTLSVQWWFYLLAASVFFIVKSRRIKIVELIMCGVFIVLDVVLIKEFGLVFSLGIIGYCLYRKIDKLIGGLIAAISGLLFVFYEKITHQVFSNYAVILLAVALIGGAAFFKTCQVNKPGMLRRAGLVTFEIYLVHYSVISFIKDSFEGLNTIFRFILGIIFSTVMSYGLYYLTETGRRIVKRKREKQETGDLT